MINPSTCPCPHSNSKPFLLSRFLVTRMIQLQPRSTASFQLFFLYLFSGFVDGFNLLQPRARVRVLPIKFNFFSSLFNVQPLNNPCFNFSPPFSGLAGTVPVGSPQPGSLYPRSPFRFLPTLIDPSVQFHYAKQFQFWYSTCMCFSIQRHVFTRPGQERGSPALSIWRA